MSHYFSDLKAAVELVKKSTNIVQVITADLGEPTKSSEHSDNFWLCPFHSENTPSFGVHSQLGVFKCFSCAEGGDVVSWVQKFHGLPLGEALEKLAEAHHIDLTPFQRQPTAEEQQIIRYKMICNKVTDFLHASFVSNKHVLTWYLQDSGFTLDKVITYNIGYTTSTSHIVQHLYKEVSGITQDDIMRLEFTNEVMWTNALVYPVKDSSGNTIRFYTKPLDASYTGGKYVGTSHKHPLFTHKLLYGFDVIKNGLRANKYRVRVVEGFKGAIASDGVATMGTNFHEDQIALLKEYGIKDIVICYDGDTAGQSAMVGLLDRLNDFNTVNTLFARLPLDEQPDTIVKKSGKQTLNAVFDAAFLPVQFYVDMHKDINGNIPLQNKFKLVSDLRDCLSSMPDIHLELNAQYLSTTLGVDVESIKAYIDDIKLTKSGLINRTAEHSVLLALLLDSKKLSIAKQIITTDKVFTTIQNQMLYVALVAAQKKAKNVGSESYTMQSIKDEIQLLFPGQNDMVSRHLDSTLGTESRYDFNDALSKIVDFYRRRVGIDQSKSLIASLHDVSRESGDIISKYRRQLVSSLDTKKEIISTPVQLAESLSKVMTERMMKKSSIIGYDFSTIIDTEGQSISGLTGLTLALSGLQPQHNIVLSANTGVGKSLLALQMAESLAVCRHPSEQIPTLWLPLEMTPDELSMRMVSQIANLNNNKVQAAMFDMPEFIRYQKAVEMLAHSQFYVRKPRSCTIDEIYSIIDEYQFKYGIKVVILDYIGLLLPSEEDRGVKHDQMLARASKILKDKVADDMKIAMVTIAQQNKQDYRAGEVRTAEQVAGSYQISQDADDLLVLIDIPPDKRDTSDGCNRKCCIDKRRGGMSDVGINMNVDFEANVNLRFMESISPQQLLGLSKGLSSG